LRLVRPLTDSPLTTHSITRAVRFELCVKYKKYQTSECQHCPTKATVGKTNDRLNIITMVIQEGILKHNQRKGERVQSVIY
jgi:hypothetical protein